MSAIPADVLNEGDAARYRAPAAQLNTFTDEEFPDRWHSAKGRLGIRAFAWRYASAVMLMLASAALMIWGVALMEATGNSTSMFSIMLGIIGLAGVLYGAYLSVVAQIKRLHDFNASGYLVLLSLIPYVGSLLPYVLMLIPGKEETNTHGVRREATLVDKIAGAIVVGLIVVVTSLAIMGLISSLVFSG